MALTKPSEMANTLVYYATTISIIIIIYRVTLRWVSCVIYCCAECHFAECHYAECHYAECHYAECHCAEWHYAECRYAKCHYAQCHCAECHYAECHYTEFHCAQFTGCPREFYVTLPTSMKQPECHFIFKK